MMMGGERLGWDVLLMSTRLHSQQCRFIHVASVQVLF